MSSKELGEIMRIEIRSPRTVSMIISNAIRVQRSLRLIMLKEGSQVLQKGHQGHLDACVTNVIRENNTEVVGDYVKACRDCIGTTRLYRHQRGCVGELELVMMHARLHKSLQGCTNSSKATL